MLEKEKLALSFADYLHLCEPVGLGTDQKLHLYSRSKQHLLESFKYINWLYDDSTSFFFLSFFHGRLFQERFSTQCLKEHEMCCDQKGKRDKLQICMKNKCLEILHQKVIQDLGSKKNVRKKQKGQSCMKCLKPQRTCRRGRG